MFQCFADRDIFQMRKVVVPEEGCHVLLGRRIRLSSTIWHMEQVVIKYFMYIEDFCK